MHGSVCPPPTGTAAAGRAGRLELQQHAGPGQPLWGGGWVPAPRLGTRDSCSSSQDQSGQRPRMGSQTNRQAPASKGSARVAYAPTAVPTTEPPDHTHARPARPPALQRAPGCMSRCAPHGRGKRAWAAQRVSCAWVRDTSNAAWSARSTELRHAFHAGLGRHCGAGSRAARWRACRQRQQRRRGRACRVGCAGTFPGTRPHPVSAACVSCFSQETRRKLRPAPASSGGWCARLARRPQPRASASLGMPVGAAVARAPAPLRPGPAWSSLSAWV